MSHELRTPLNSLLILSKLLADNREGNLTDKQVEFAATIHSAGTDLLALISDILDLSKVEAGKMDVAPGARADGRGPRAPPSARSGRSPSRRTSAFEIEVADDAPKALFTDEQRLQQVLRNLLSNAMKFTEDGSVTPARRVDRRAASTARRTRWPSRSTDTGIGIAEDKLRLIFEAFQQADGTTSRRYGGTGLGLSISREIARLLGGEIRVEVARRARARRSRCCCRRRSSRRRRAELGRAPSAAAPLERPPAPGRRGRSPPRRRAAPATATARPRPRRRRGADDRGRDPPGRPRGPARRRRRRRRGELGARRWPAQRGFKGSSRSARRRRMALAQEHVPDGVVAARRRRRCSASSSSDPRTRHLPVLRRRRPSRRATTALRAGAAGFSSAPATREALGARVQRPPTSSSDRRPSGVLVVEDDDDAERDAASPR